MKIYSIEAVDMGNDQEKIASKIEEYVEGMDFASKDQFFAFEGKLVARACREMGWQSTPQTGGLLVEWE